jgi:hypothetical protein
MHPSTLVCQGAFYLIANAIQGLGEHAIQPVCLFQQGVLKHTLHKQRQEISATFPNGQHGTGRET